MKIYFNANNKATLEALQKCGVKNVLVSHRYSYANINKFRKEFESIFVVAGTKGDPEKYHAYIRSLNDNMEYCSDSSEDYTDDLYVNSD